MEVYTCIAYLPSTRFKQIHVSFHGFFHCQRFSGRNAIVGLGPDGMSPPGWMAVVFSWNPPYFSLCTRWAFPHHGHGEGHIVFGLSSFVRVVFRSLLTDDEAADIRDTVAQRWVNHGPASQTMARDSPSIGLFHIGSMFGVRPVLNYCRPGSGDLEPSSASPRDQPGRYALIRRTSTDTFFIFGPSRYNAGVPSGRRSRTTSPVRRLLVRTGFENVGKQSREEMEKTSRYAGQTCRLLQGK